MRQKLNQFKKYRDFKVKYLNEDNVVLTFDETSAVLEDNKGLGNNKNIIGGIICIQ